MPLFNKTPSAPDPLSQGAVDGLISAVAAAPKGAPNPLTAKLDHLVHALSVSGGLAHLTAQQVHSIVYALYSAGHLVSGTPVAPYGHPVTFDADGLITVQNADFMRDPAFLEAYNRGVAAQGSDNKWHWRIHVALWAASVARSLPGDFVECGVNFGFMSSAIMKYLDWNSVGKRFFLLDTFQGLDERFVSEEEKQWGAGCTYPYTECFEDVRKNFAEWTNCILIRGAVPLTLPQAETEQVCFLHIDMNCAAPEAAAIDYFWDRLVPGAISIFDDYGFNGHIAQKHAIDEFAARKGVRVLSLPTGQGMIVKPGSSDPSPVTRLAAPVKAIKTAGFSAAAVNPSTFCRYATSSAVWREILAFHGALATDDFVRQVDAYYRDSIARYGEAWWHLDIVNVLYAAAKLIRPKNYLEIGVRRGRSCQVVARACPDVRITGCDMWMTNYAGMENPGPDFVRTQLADQGYRGEAEFLSGDSHVLIPEFFRSNPDLMFDLITVDGDHSEEGALADLQAVLDRLAPGGMLVFDDIAHPLHPYLLDVWRRATARPNLLTCEYTETGYGIAFAVNKLG